MEAAGQVTSGVNIGVFKEPRGFIKVLEFVLSIFAFATTTSHKSSTTFSILCANATQPEDRTFYYSYPYDLESECFKLCDTDAKQFCLLSGSKSSAEFYVFVGVIVFLYCLAALVLYIFFDDLYRRNTRLVIVDFIISVVLTLLWIIASSAWAAGVSDVKTYTDPEEGGIFGTGQCQKDLCKVKSLGNFASLNVSLIFGFLNFGVWIGNLWFIYKETPWFKLTSKPPTEPDQHSPISGNNY
ncbi:synaptophysin-like isoform X2 [Biomphalaria glabrata]|uniref:Synaptophysin-like isoform X2 n=1 Tax=Biomphalaria glabrata TaxID=6526 RepID=A0A9W3A7L4_BIOGL|nr:synaptophysin-like isoform X2 [Biomphalaria glabrata]